MTELNDRRVELSVGNERKDGELKLVRERMSTYRSQISAAWDVLEESKRRIGEIDDGMALGAQKRKADTARIAVIENETDVLRSAVSALDSKIAVFERLTDEKAAQSALFRGKSFGDQEEYRYAFRAQGSDAGTN